MNPEAQKIINWLKSNGHATLAYNEDFNLMLTKEIFQIKENTRFGLAALLNQPEHDECRNIILSEKEI